MALDGGGRSAVRRQGDVVIRDAGPWTSAVHALLRHLEQAGFEAAPRLVGRMIELAICDTAAEADDAAVTPASTAHPVALWAMAWRARSAAWMIRHRPTLEAALALRT